MSEHFIYSIGKWNGEPPLGSASFPESRHPQEKPIVESKVDGSRMRTTPGNTRLIFEVDSKDQSVVVMIVDEESSKVIRTIPGDAFADLPGGGLLNKNA